MPFWSTDFQEDVTLKDPKRAFRFTVSIMGINSVNGGPVLWYATSVTWDPVTIKMVDPAGDPDVAATLSAIVEASGYSVPTNASTENLTSMSKAKAAGALGRVLITQIDSNGSPIETWTLWNAFVTKLEYGGELKYGEEALTEYSMELTFDWARVDTLAGSSAIALGGTSFYNS